MKPIFTASFGNAEQASSFAYKKGKELEKDYHVIITAPSESGYAEFKLHTEPLKQRQFINAKKYGRI